VAYRQSFEACPRCRALLEDAGTVRVCPECRGQWVLEPVLAEMVIAMLPPGVLGTLTLVPMSGTQRGPCPSCGIEMETVALYGVAVERCPKDHGVWFDPDELQAGLLRSADPERGASAPIASASREPRGPVAPAAPVAPVAPSDPSAPWLDPAPELGPPSVGSWATPPTPPARDRTKLDAVLARMKNGETFTDGYGRAFTTYGWDPETKSLYSVYQEDTYEEPRSSLSATALDDLIATDPERFR
jgi:Zn-finger nucleic acid-binding protein